MHLFVAIQLFSVPENGRYTPSQTFTISRICKFLPFPMGNIYFPSWHLTYPIPASTFESMIFRLSREWWDIYHSRFFGRVCMGQQAISHECLHRRCLGKPPLPHLYASPTPSMKARGHGTFESSSSVAQSLIHKASLEIKLVAS